MKIPVSTDRGFAYCAPGADGYRADHPAAAHVRIEDPDQGLLDLRGRRNIALCGFAESSRAKIPVNDPSWVLCGLNQLYRHLPRWDVWFDMHSYWPEGNLEGTDHEGWLGSCGIPVIMTDRVASIPTSVRFPIERLINRSGGVDYLTSTASFMVAWAIDHIDRQVAVEADQVEGPYRLAEAAKMMRELYGRYAIAIFGIDLLAEEEFIHQKPCMEFWIGRAAARGIGILIPKESALLKQTYRYGYQREPDTGLLRLAEVEAHGQELDTALTAAMARVERLAGRREEQMMWRTVLQVRLRGGTMAVPQLEKLEE